MEEKRKVTSWTAEQRKAIDTRDKTLLVSAAAGSGKTATLTERIIEQITDDEHPVDLSDILVVTYTNAAAAELRERVAKALRKAASEHPEDLRLARQLLTVGSAHIQTIHAYCKTLLSQSADVIGLSPDFRICDAGETELLSSSVMERLINDVYDGHRESVGSAERFEELADCLTAAKDSGGLSQVFMGLYRKCSGQVDGVRSLRKLIALYDPAEFTSPSDTPFGVYAHDEIAAFAEDISETYERHIRRLSGGNPSEEALALFLTAEKERLSLYKDAKTFKDQQRANAFFAESGGLFPRMITTKKSEASDLTTAAKKMRKEKHEAFSKKILDYFLWDDDEWRAHFETIFRTGTVLCNFLEEFEREFTAEKRRLNLVDFSDLEHLAYHCLYSEEGELTPLALSVRASFAAVYIDEYQDVNRLQDAIFAAVSREDNRFMVGDIKQCIYCFRGAEPSIFAGMKQRFSPLTEAEAKKEKQATLFLSRNFRCDKPVIDFVNGIFDTLFPLAVPELGHNVGTDTLRVGKAPEKQGNFIPEIHLIPKPEKACGEEADSDLSPDTDWEKTKAEAEASARERQAFAVAKKVSELVSTETKSDGSPIGYSDIAILLRNFTGVEVYRSALERAGIPTLLSDTTYFFYNAEVLLALSLLTAIDNPHRDVYLSGLLCSPLFSFTGDELLRLRRAGGDSLYDALRIAAGKDKTAEAHPDEISDALREKTDAFLRTLAHYRMIAEEMRTDLLISRLCRETGLLPLASNNGGKNNLLALQNFAKTYEQNGFHGLSGFLSYIREMINSGARIESAESGKEADAVHIVTDHKSKGLEYPIVLLAECQATIDDKSKKDRISFAPDFGFSLRDRAPGGFALVDNAVQNIVDDRIFDNLYAEELRILYVAATRAKERLYLFGNVKEDPDLFRDRMREKKEHLTRYSAKHLSSFLEMAMMSEGAFRVVTDDTDVSMPLASSLSEKVSAPPDERRGEEEFVLSDETELKKKLLDRFTFSYPSPEETALPKKLSVSMLSPVVLDSTENESVCLTIEAYGSNSGTNITDSDNNTLQKHSLPAFFSGEISDRSAKQGIATHLFLQFCDFAALKENGAEAELARLLAEGFLSAEDGALVRLDEIKKFERSALLQAICEAKELYRELRFHSKLPAEMFSADAARKEALAGKVLLVQGVIDCVYEDREGNLHLIDYKTDRLSPAARGNKSLAQKILAGKHSLQLSYYAAAIEKMFGKRPVTTEVYSLPLGDTVAV